MKHYSHKLQVIQKMYDEILLDETSQITIFSITIQIFGFSLHRYFINMRYTSARGWLCNYR